MSMNISREKKHVPSHSSKYGGSFSASSFKKYAFEKLSYDHRTLSAEISHCKEESEMLIGRPASAGIVMKATRDQGPFLTIGTVGEEKVLKGPLNICCMNQQPQKTYYLCCHESCFLQAPSLVK